VKRTLRGLLLCIGSLVMSVRSQDVDEA
jgi:hypothetical protein